MCIRDRTRAVRRRTKNGPSKRIIGFAYQQAGWKIVGTTSRGLITLAKFNSPLACWGDPWQANDPDLTYRPEDYWPNRPNTGDQWDPTAGGTPHKNQRTQNRTFVLQFEEQLTLI